MFTTSRFSAIIAYVFLFGCSHRDIGFDLWFREHNMALFEDLRYYIKACLLSKRPFSI